MPNTVRLLRHRNTRALTKFSRSSILEHTAHYQLLDSQSAYSVGWMASAIESSIVSRVAALPSNTFEVCR